MASAQTMNEKRITLTETNSSFHTKNRPPAWPAAGTIKCSQNGSLLQSLEALEVYTKDTNAKENDKR